MISSSEILISGRPSRSSILISRHDLAVDDFVDRRCDQDFQIAFDAVADQALLLGLCLFVGGEQHGIDIVSLPEVSNAVFIFEIIDRTLRDGVVFHVPAESQESYDLVVRRTLQPGDQRYRFFTESVNQYLLSLLAVFQVVFDQIVYDNHGDADQDQSAKRQKQVE